MKSITKYAGLLSALVLCASVARAAESAELWTKNCASCHGKDGAGHTKAGHMKHVKDMTSAEYQKSFTDDQAAARIKEGYKGDNGEEKMKAFGSVLSDAEVKSLVGYVRSLQK